MQSRSIRLALSILLPLLLPACGIFRDSPRLAVETRTEKVRLPDALLDCPPLPESPGGPEARDATTLERWFKKVSAWVLDSAQVHRQCEVNAAEARRLNAAP